MRRSVLGGLTLSMTVALTACGDGGAGVETAPTTGASSTSVSPSPSDDATPSPDSAAATADPTPDGGGDTFASFTPAAGPLIASSTSSINAPAGWEEPLLDGAGGNTGPSLDTRYNVLLDDNDVVRQQSLDELVTSVEKFGGFVRGRRLPDVVLAGLPAYHYAGFDDYFGNHVDEFGFNTAERDILIRISTPKRLPRAERDQVVGEIAASFRLL